MLYCGHLITPELMYTQPRHASKGSVKVAGWVLCMQVVGHAAEVQKVVAICCGSDLLKATLPTLLEQLELCQKSLTAYLEAKRAEFPRLGGVATAPKSHLKQYMQSYIIASTCMARS